MAMLALINHGTDNMGRWSPLGQSSAKVYFFSGRAASGSYLVFCMKGKEVSIVRSVSERMDMDFVYQQASSTKYNQLRADN